MGERLIGAIRDEYVRAAGGTPFARDRHERAERFDAAVRQVRAQALRDAADDLEGLVDSQHPKALNPDTWLRDRADAEERGE